MRTTDDIQKEYVQTCQAIGEIVIKAMLQVMPAVHRVSMLEAEMLRATSSAPSPTPVATPSTYPSRYESGFPQAMLDPSEPVPLGMEFELPIP